MESKTPKEENTEKKLHNCNCFLIERQYFTNAQIMILALMKVERCLHIIFILKDRIASFGICRSAIAIAWNRLTKAKYQFKQKIRSHSPNQPSRYIYVRDGWLGFRKAPQAIIIQDLRKRSKLSVHLHYLRTDSSILSQYCIICAQIIPDLSQYGTTCVHLMLSRRDIVLLVDT